MKLLLRRSQKTTGMIRETVTFMLSVRAELSSEEKANIAKYKLGSGLLYESKELGDPGEGWKGLGRTIMHRMLTLSISVNDLENGKQVECKDIGEMLAAEEQIKEAARVFKAVLHAASKFDGEEVIEIP